MKEKQVGSERIFTRKEKDLALIKKESSSSPKSAGVYWLPTGYEPSQELPNTVMVFYNGKASTLSELKRINSDRQGLWALFGPFGGHRPFAVFVGKNQLPLTNWPPAKYWLDNNPFPFRLVPDNGIGNFNFFNGVDLSKVSQPAGCNVPGMEWTNY